MITRIHDYFGTALLTFCLAFPASSPCNDGYLPMSEGTTEKISELQGGIKPMTAAVPIELQELLVS